MTDDDVWTSCIAWVRAVTGIVTVIRAYEGGERPTPPYVMVNFTGTIDVREWPMEMEYTPERADEPPPSGSPPVPIRITATPVIEKEWRFSTHAFGPMTTDLLRPIPAARHVAQTHELIKPLTVFDTSQVRYVPEYINEAWEPRANIDIFLRGLTRDGFVIDSIDAIEPLILTREGTA